jgi:hypothetical protein
MISDLILSLFAFYFYAKHRIISPYWGNFFLFMALSAIIGSMYHGATELGELVRFTSWGMVSVSLIFGLMAVYKNLNSKYLNWFFIIKSTIFLFLSIHYSVFYFIVIDTAVSLLGFVALGDWLYLKSNSKWITYGILLSLVSVLFIVLKFSFDPNYLSTNDIGHYITILSLMLISKGVREDSLKELGKRSLNS